MNEGRLQILIADDNRDAADSLAMWLRLAGHDVDVAYDGLRALDAASARCPDVALLDLALPGIDGYELATRLRRSNPDRTLWILAVTGYGEEEQRLRSRAAGFDGHIVKPVDPERLSRLIARLSST